MDTSRFEQAYHRLLYKEGDSNTIRDWFPKPAECNAFLRFSREKMAGESAQWTGPKMTRGELVAAIDSSNLLTMSFATTVVPALNTRIRPWVPVSRCANGFLYRLILNSWGLSTNNEEVWDNMLQLYEYILTIKNLEGKEEFAFIQSGQLVYYLLPYTFLTCEHFTNNVYFTIRPMTKDGVGDDTVAKRLEWKETGFYLVARIGQQGRIDGVYAIYNMEREDSLTGRDGKYYPNDENWGKPLGSGEGNEAEDKEEKQIFCARLADRMGNFGCGYHVCWGDVTFSSPVRLGYVLRDRLVRDDVFR